MVSQAIQATTGGLQMLGRLEAVCAAHGLETRAAALREVASDVSPDLARVEAALRALPQRQEIVGKAACHLLGLAGKRVRPLCVLIASRR